MNENLNELMREATRLTRGGKLGEATAVLQRWLSSGKPSTAVDAANAVAPAGDVLDGCVFEVEQPHEPLRTQEVPTSRRAPTSQGSKGEFLAGTHTHASLTRQYKLYVPPAAERGEALPLIVMLHGCTQNPDDFAVGTGMNELAAQRGFLVLYPAQSQDANPSRCWNWFKHNHQQRDRGEPALIASLTQAVMAEHRIDPDRVYVAGLSAGAAMAAIMGATHPELYAAVGVHSGLAPGVANNVGEALSAMNGASAITKSPRQGLNGRPSLRIATIVFHGDQDSTVNPLNGVQVMEARLHPNQESQQPPELMQGEQGRRFTRKTYRDASGLVMGEHWLIHGAGHAWSGGNAAGSYTDVLGPDASAEMLRFFLEHPHAH